VDFLENMNFTILQQYEYGKRGCLSLQQVSSSERIKDTSTRFEMLQGKNQISVIYALDVDLHQYSFMPCPFTGPKMFWAGPNFLCQTKNLFTY